MTIPKEIKDSGLSVAYSVAFSPDGKDLLSAGGNGIRQWQVSDGREVWRSLNDDSVYAIASQVDSERVQEGDKRVGRKVPRQGPRHGLVQHCAYGDLLRLDQICHRDWIDWDGFEFGQHLGHLNWRKV